MVIIIIRPIFIMHCRSTYNKYNNNSNITARPP